jgi:hypothetical protein
MINLALNMGELSALKDLLESDMEKTSWNDVEYDDVDLMEFYLHRARIYQAVMVELA